MKCRFENGCPYERPECGADKEVCGVLELKHLRAGSVFRCLHGRLWRRHRMNSKHIVYASPLDGGKDDCFCPSALVRKVEKGEVKA